MIKGPIKLKAEGKIGSGKITLLHKIKVMLEKEGFTALWLDEDAHTLEIQKGE